MLRAVRSLAICAIALATGCTSDPAPTPTPTATAASPSPTASELPTFGAITCCQGIAVTPGRYQMPPWFDIALTMQLGPGWRAVNESRAKVFALVQGTHEWYGGTRYAYLIALPSGRAPGGLFEELGSQQGVEARGSGSTDVGDHPAPYRDAVVTRDPSVTERRDAGIPAGTRFLDAVGQFLDPGFNMTTVTPDAHVRFVVVPRAAGSLLVYVEAPPAEFPAFATAVNAILKSVRFT